MPSAAICIAIPTVHGGPLLHACLASLDKQTEPDFEVVVIDNSESGAVEIGAFRFIPRVHRALRNLGFAAAVNWAWSTSGARFLASLNDDAEAHPDWLAALRGAMDAEADVGMCASQVLLHGTTQIDSAGMLIFGDGSSKQRGHSKDASLFQKREDVLLPSASAALYRREMIDDIGMFDEDFFLYCEDTDLGLRARRNGWRCVYVPTAIVEHHYSQSSGAASPLKAWQIERNRLWVAAKNFPNRMLLAMPLYGAWRYFWHFVFMLGGRGSASTLQREGSGAFAILSILIRAHIALIANLPTLLRKRKAIQRCALLTDQQFITLLHRHRISAREIASQ